MMKNERGFTIMELLVVIVIIGVLAAIGVPAYNNMVAKSRKAVCQANRRTLDTATGLYHIEKSGWPSALADLIDYLDNAADMKCPEADATYSFDAGTEEAAGSHKWKCSVSDHNN